MYIYFIHFQKNVIIKLKIYIKYPVVISKFR